MVVGAPGHLRDSYRLWNEPKGPDFVLEVTSASTRREDERRKREVYASLGVAEYFLYDPRGGVPDAATSWVSVAGRRVPAPAGGDGVAEPRHHGAQRGARSRPSGRARGSDVAAARPGSGTGPAHVPGVGTGSRRGGRRAPTGSRGSTTRGCGSTGCRSPQRGAGSSRPRLGERPGIAASTANIARPATPEARAVGTRIYGASMRTMDVLQNRLFVANPHGFGRRPCCGSTTR